MTKNKNIKVVGIVKDDAITGISYGMVDIKTSGKTIIQNDKTNTLCAAWRAAQKMNKSFWAKLHYENKKHK